MGRKNKITQLNYKLIKEINELIRGGKLTLDQLIEFVNQHKLNDNEPISRSGLGRYSKKFNETTKELQELEHLIKTLPKSINFDSENELHRLLYQILSKAILDASMGQKLDAGNILYLAKSLQSLTTATKDREKLKKEIKALVQDEAIETVENIATQTGLSQSTISIITKALRG